MLNPASKGWIDKYLSLIQQNEIKLHCDDHCGIAGEHYLHLILGSSGMSFGVHSHFIFLKNKGENRWGKQEKLKLLFFESLLLIFYENSLCNGKSFDSSVFLEELECFFELEETQIASSNWSDFLRFSRPNKLEEIIDKRTQIPLSLDNKIWINYLQNSLCIIDIFLFKDYLNGSITKESIIDKRLHYAEVVLSMVVNGAHADGVLKVKEKTIFDLFLASAAFDNSKRAYYQELLKTGIDWEMFPSLESESLLFRKYLLDISIFTVWSDTDFSENEYAFLQKVAYQLQFNENDLNDAYSIVESFILENDDVLPFLQSSNSYDKVFNRLSNRWSKVILRNKDRLTQEIRESRELVELVRKSAVSELTKDEKEKVKTQFLDIIKSVPALAIFMLPGGVVLLPLILKIIPSLIPSAFRDNEVDKDF